MKEAEDWKTFMKRIHSVQGGLCEEQAALGHNFVLLYRSSQSHRVSLNATFVDFLGAGLDIFHRT